LYFHRQISFNMKQYFLSFLCIFFFLNYCAQVEPISIIQGTNKKEQKYLDRNLIYFVFPQNYGRISDNSETLGDITQEEKIKWTAVKVYNSSAVYLDFEKFGTKIITISPDESYCVKYERGEWGESGRYFIHSTINNQKILVKNEDGSAAELNLSYDHTNNSFRSNYEGGLRSNYYFKDAGSYFLSMPTSQTGKFIISRNGELYDSKTGFALKKYSAAIDKGSLQPFFLNDKFCLSNQPTNNNDYYGNRNNYLRVIDVDKETTAYNLSGEYMFFSFDEKMIVTSNNVVNSSTGEVILTNTIEGFSDDLLFAYNGSKIYNLTTGRLFYDFGSFHDILSIEKNKVTTVYQKIENHEFDFERIKVYGNYRTQIDQEISAILPKDEFETLEAYNARLSKEKNSIFSKYENINAERSKELIKQIQESYSQVQFTIESIGQYVPEREEFPITINGTTMSIKIPLEEAKTFKPNVTSAKVTASKQLNVTGTEYAVFNIKIAHPITGSIYPFGEQRKPLYLDETVVKSAEAGVPVLSLSAKLIEPSGNNLIDGNENAQIELTISNSGNGIAKDIRINMSAENAVGLKFEQAQKLTGIAAGQDQKVILPIEANRDVVSGSVTFNINVTEWKGFNPAPIDFTVNTQEFKKPKLVYIESGIKELMGNGNNIIENNEIIEVSALIQNTGQGTAEETDVFFKIKDSNIITTTPAKLNQRIGAIESGDSRTINFAFTVNNEYTGADNLPLEISISEKFQEYGGTFPLNLEMKKVSLTAQSIKIDGQYKQDVAIQEVSLTSDVDKNIPEDTLNFPNKYALIIGNEHYSKYQTGLNTESDVAFASNDANAFAKYAEKTLGVPEKQITLLIDANSTVMKRELNRITSLAQYSNGEAELIIYYAGHGFPDTTKAGYIIPVDVTGADVTSGIKLADMYKQLAGANPKKVTIFLDACFSGGGRDAGLLAARGIKVIPKTEPIEGNLVIFSASSAEQASLPYSEKTHGLFTYFLLKKLQETKGNVSYQELGAYIRQEVQLKSMLVNKQDQNPEVLFSPSIENQWGTWMMK
jgi:hypothetical protein